MSFGCVVVLRLPLTVGGLAQAGIFTTTFHTKPKVQIYEKLLYEALNSRLRQTAVSGKWLSVVRCVVFGCVSAEKIKKKGKGKFLSGSEKGKAYRGKLFCQT